MFVRGSTCHSLYGARQDTCTPANDSFATLLQLNISFPATGCQKLIEVDDERKLRIFYEKRMATEVAADPLGDEWKVSVDSSSLET